MGFASQNRFSAFQSPVGGGGGAGAGGTPGEQMKFPLPSGAVKFVHPTQRQPSGRNP
jgi:hypothetical protein